VKKLWIIIEKDIIIGSGIAILQCGLPVNLADLVVGGGICNMVEKKLKKVLDKCYLV